MIWQTLVSGPSLAQMLHINLQSLTTVASKLWLILVNWDRQQESRGILKIFNLKQICMTKPGVFWGSEEEEEVTGGVVSDYKTKKGRDYLTTPWSHIYNGHAATA